MRTCVKHAPFGRGHVLAGSADYSDPQNFLMLLESGSGFNYAQWSNEEYDAPDGQGPQRRSIWRNAQRSSTRPKRSSAKKLPYLPLMYYGSLSLVLRQVAWLGRQPAQCGIRPRWMSHRRVDGLMPGAANGCPCRKWPGQGGHGQGGDICPCPVSRFRCISEDKSCNRFIPQCPEKDG